MLILASIIFGALALYLRFFYKSPAIPFTFLRNHRDQIDKTRVLLVTAHPKDECVFFSPTLIALYKQPEVQVHLLCLTSGNHENTDIGRQELERSCAVMGIEQKYVTLLDHPDLRSSPNAQWDITLVGHLVEEHITKHHIERLITFDEQGVSGHANHIAVERGIRHILVNSPAIKSLNLPTYTLTSVSPLRKYLALFDLFLVLYTSGQGYKDNANTLLFVNSMEDYQRGVHAIQQHHVQKDFSHQLHVYLSRYMYLNVLQRIE